MKNFKILVLLGLSLGTSLAFAEATYTGSSFNEVLGVLHDQNYQPKTEIEKSEFAVYQSGNLPQYPVNATSLFSAGSGPLERDSKRTVSERFDYYDRLAKMLHPNGICVTGKWTIDKKTPYSGYFAQGAEGLYIGRISVAMEDTTSKDDRGFGFAGKVFPTLDKNQVVETGNFFTVDVLLGDDTPRALNAFTTNEPDKGFNLSLLGLFFKIAGALQTADQNPGFRPLTQVASLGNPAQVKQPHWIRLSTPSSVIRNDQPDFRNEIQTAILDNKKVTYLIEVSDTTKDRTAVDGWNQIGKIELDSAFVSYGCDRRLHFSHPKLK